MDLKPVESTAFINKIRFFCVSTKVGNRVTWLYTEVPFLCIQTLDVGRVRQHGQIKKREAVMCFVRSSNSIETTRNRQ